MTAGRHVNLRCGVSLYGFLGGKLGRLTVDDDDDEMAVWHALTPPHSKNVLTPQGKHRDNWHQKQRTALFKKENLRASASACVAVMQVLGPSNGDALELDEMGGVRCVCLTDITILLDIYHAAKQRYAAHRDRCWGDGLMTPTTEMHYYHAAARLWRGICHYVGAILVAILAK